MKKNKKKICPVCNSIKTQCLFLAPNAHGSTIYDETNKFEYFRCAECNAVFLVGVKPNHKYYQTFYNNDYRGEHTDSRLASYIINNSNTIKMNLIAKYVIPGSHRIKILDIGSGTGTFLSQLSDNVYEKWGVEIEKKLTRLYKKLGIRGINQDFLTYNFKKQKFDCITMWHVIEHIHDPQKLIKKINSLLAKDGIFIFSTPNTNCIGFKKGKENWFHLDAPRHFILYDYLSLSKIAQKNNFDVIETRNNWHDFPMDLYWSLKFTPSKYFYYLLYPVFKFKDEETITCVWRKTS